MNSDPFSSFIMFGIPVISFIAAGAGAYLSSYLMKKGDNLATKEDIGTLTKITEEIKRQINDQVWNKQRQWELKRDSVISLVQTMDGAKDALMRYAARRDSVKGTDVDPNRFDFVQNALVVWADKASAFDASRAAAALTCSKELNDAFYRVQQSLRCGYSRLSKKEIQNYDDIGAEIRDGMIAAVTLSRRELGIADDAAPEPNEPWAPVTK